MSDLQKFNPAAGAHAIEVMALAIEWAEPLTDEQLGAIRAAYDSQAELRALLPAVHDVRSIRVSAPNGVAELVHESKANFDFIQPSEIPRKNLWAVSARREFLACNCGEYDRWASVKPKAIERLLPFMSAALTVGAQIGAIGLEYQDGLHIHADVGSQLPGLVFATDSPWIPPVVWKHPTLWHVHQGWFSKGLDGHRVLNNLNIDLVPGPNRLELKVRGQHRLLATSFVDASPMSIAAETLPQVLDELHVINKQVLCSLFNEAVLDSIGMTWRPDETCI